MPIAARSLLAGVTALLLTAAWAPATATQGAVEVAVRHAAAVVRVLDTSYLVHEAWITNGRTTAVTLEEVTVLDASRPVASYRDDALRQRIGRPGLPRTHPTPAMLEPSQDAVVYFWIPLDPNGAVPARLRHRVALRAAGATADEVVEGGETSVSPASDAEVLDAPLRGDGWASVYDPVLVGGHRTATYTVDGTTRIPGRFAIDWMQLLPSGRAHTDAATRPANWNGFGADVLAVKDARVAAAVDGRPDADGNGRARETITRDNAAGNHIVLELGNGRFAFYEHLQQGSIAVRTGDRVTRGQTIARVGSSGSVSSGPHLHFHVADGSSPLGAEGVPFVLRTFRTTGAFPSIAAFAKGDTAAALPNGLAPSRSLERPAPNAVVQFPQ